MPRICICLVTSCVLLLGAPLYAQQSKDDAAKKAAKADVEAKKKQAEAKADAEKKKKQAVAKADAEAKKKQFAVDTSAPKPIANPHEFAAEWLNRFSWREIGPTSMGGRIVDLAVVEQNPAIYWAATASGGVFKTTNNGVTFEPQFQHESSICIGAVAVAPSNSEHVWVGTGESNARNSVSWGDGVYKSTDGGKTWKRMGLKNSFQIGRILIHPTKPDTVYVAAVGRLWGPNSERGVFKTTDGGETWSQVLYVDDNVGCIDLAMQTGSPDTLLAAMYQRRRDAYDGGDPAVRFGWGAGLFKTTDGGLNWRRISNGLPSVKLGRISFSFMKSKPNVVYSLVETERIGAAPKGAKRPALMGIQGNPADASATLTQVTPNGAAAKAGLKTGDVVVEIGGEKVGNYNALVAQIRKRSAGDKVKVKARRGDKTVTVDLTFTSRGAGGRRAFGTRLGGQTANVQDKQGEDGFQTGGVFKSTDGGESWARVNSLNPRPFYFSQIRVDPNNENIIFVLGISLHRSEDGGKTFRPNGGVRTHPDHHAMWINPANSLHILLGCDGGMNNSYDGSKTWDFLNHMPIGQFYHVGVDVKAPYNVYGGLQDNGSWGGPSARRGNTGPIVDDWFVIGGGDGFICLADPQDPDLIYYESQYGRMGRVNLRTGARNSIRPRSTQENPLRFNWKTPFLLSNHNSRIFYCFANHVFKSLDRGSDLRRISPDLTTTEQGTGTALAESPRNPDVLYAGTDDGNLWVTTDGGKQWTRRHVPGVKKGRVNSIEASRFVEGRAYVVYDAHYYNDDKPYVFVTEDFGKTWSPLHAKLPVGSTRVLREDVSNRNVLYLGAEFGLWVTLDRGVNWHRLNNNLPNAAIHEIAVHPTAGEIVAATHGRSLWVLDVSALRQMTAETLAGGAHLFKPRKAVIWRDVVGKRQYGARRFIGKNPVAGGVIYYSVPKNAKQVQLTVKDIQGQTVAQLRTERTAGLHRSVWPLRSRTRTERGRPTFRAAPPGDYLITLNVDGVEKKQLLQVARDPEFTANTLTFDEEETLRKERKRVDD